MTVELGYLGLGSNLGDRRAMLQAAVEDLWTHGVQVFAASSVYETEPVGEVLDQPEFLNACVAIETALGPEALLDACKAVEAALGREKVVRHGPRAIDVDVLLLGTAEYESERLAVPAPGARRAPLRARPAARARPGPHAARRHAPGRRAGGAGGPGGATGRAPVGGARVSFTLVSRSCPTRAPARPGVADVLPMHAPQVRSTVTAAYGLSEPPDDARLLAIADAWRPYRSWVCLLLRASD